MIKQDIIDHLTYNCGLHRSSAIAAVNGTISLLSSTLAKGESVYLRGLGTLKVREVAQKTARNISANTQIVIPAHKSVKFIPGNEIKQSLSPR